MMPDKPFAAADQPRRKVETIEVAVFLFLIVPSLVLSFFVVRPGSFNFSFAASVSIVRDISLLSLVLYFIWRNGEGLASLGWNFANLPREFFLGVVLFFPTLFAAGILENIMQQLGFSSPSTHIPKILETGIWEVVLAFFLVMVVAVTEETIFRGYLLLRFQKSLQMAPFSAALLSTVIFSLGHGYEGITGVVSVGFIGLIFALVYQWRQSLVAPIVMHFLQDFFSIILSKLLGLY